MNAVSEAEVADFIRNKAVKRMNIIQTDDGKYRIVVTLTWKTGDWNLVNARRHPRKWASLDRLSRHILSEYGEDLPPINLVLGANLEKTADEVYKRDSQPGDDE